LISLALCIAAFLICFALGRRAIWLGVVATLAIGYFYGILRANIEQTASHFIYDGGAAGLYLALMTQPGGLTGAQRFKLRAVMPWALCLMGWPTLLFFVPVQDPLVQLVGWRGQIFFVPFLMIGAVIDGDDLRRIGKWMGILNMAALLFAVAETKLGVERFYPHNAVDEIIYLSNDVFYGGQGHYRIPATFTSSAAYAGNMVASMPLLLGSISVERKRFWRYAMMAMAALTAVGVFLAASRSAAVLLFVMAGLITVSGRFKNIPWGAWIVGIVAVGWLVSVTPQMQRFFTLSDTEYVKQRVGWSVNETFLDMALDYPMGNGLGGGGTSMPYFLASLVKHPVLIENEYGRIMLEQGIPGLVMWIGFILWALTRPPLRRSDPWSVPQWLARLFCATAFATGSLGTGLLTGIPYTSVLMLFCGWLAVPQEDVALRARRAARIASRPKLRSFQAALPG